MITVVTKIRVLIKFKNSKICWTVGAEIAYFESVELDVTDARCLSSFEEALAIAAHSAMAAHATDPANLGGEQFASSRRRWSALSGFLAAAVCIGVAVQVHSTGAGVVVALAPTKVASQLFRGSFQRAEGVVPKDYDVKLDESSYIAGEQHVMNDLFEQQETEDSAVKTAFYDAREKMTRVLQAAIEKQEELEKFVAVEAEHRFVT